MRMLDRSAAQARRVYSDLVRRRSTVRIVDAAEIDDSMPLHFIVGLYRSGTTALRYSLSSHPEIAAPPETDFLDSLLKLRHERRAVNGLGAMGFQPKTVDRRLREFANFFYSNYGASLGASVVVDKTPLYTFLIDDLIEVFPSARFIALFRNPFGQIRSITDGLRIAPNIPNFPSQEGDELSASAARYWASGTGRLVELCNNHPTRAIPVPYEAMCAEPNLWMKTILDHLAVDWDDSVLGYDASTIDVGNEGGKAAGHSRLVEKPIDLSPFNEADRGNVARIAGELSLSLGYKEAERRPMLPAGFRESVRLSEEIATRLRNG